MGEVYRARDPRLGREVAIKVLPASFSQDADRLRRFEQEARAASALNQPNILTIHDVGEAEQGPYVVSELLEGETLRAILADGKLPARKALDFAVQIARGLAAAHEKGIVHRDLKPENLFVTRDGRVKILDFGLAKLTEPERPVNSATEAPTAAPATEAGVVLGTLHYMSPEQACGKPADARSDIFSFGAVLYEMLSGKKAFSRDSTAETLSAILKEEPSDLSLTDPGVPPGLDRIVRHCLEKDPERRFRSAHDLAFDLESLSDLSKPSEPGTRLAAGRRSVFLAALVAAFVMVVGLLLWRTRGNRPGGPDSSGRKSIAVLPFQNLSPDPDNAFFADGMTEDILTQLAKIRDLKVISRTSVMRYKDTRKPVKEIAAELGVATVLEGSVRRAGDRVRVVGQLVDGRTDEHLWAETYDRELKDVFAIQSEVAQQIASALRATLSPEERKRIEQRPTENLAAYDLYLKGREIYNHYRKADNESAIELFRKALELDSNFALGYAGLGDAYAQRVLRFGSPQSELEASLQAGRKAIALDPELAEGHKALGLAYQVKGAYRESLESHRKAVEINGLGVGVYNVGAVLRNLGKLDEALPWMLRASDVDPQNPIAPVGIAGVYATLRDFGQAERWMKRGLEIQPDLSQAHRWRIWLSLQQHRDEDALRHARTAMTLLPGDAIVTEAAATAELIAGNLPRAEQLFEQSLSAFRGKRISPPLAGVGVETNLASLHLKAGRRGQADALLEESLATNRRAAEAGNQDWTLPFDTACVHALREEKDEAFRLLDKAVESGWRGWPLGTRSPLLDSLRGDPRFRRLEARLDDLVRQMRRRAGLT